MAGDRSGITFDEILPEWARVDLDRQAVEESERLVRMIVLRLARREYGAAIAAIEEAQKEYELSFRPRTADDRSLLDVGLPMRVANMLEDRGILTVCGLAQESDKELLAIPGMGRVQLKILHELLERFGLQRDADEE